VSTNYIAGTQIFDAIDLCSNANTARSNTIYGSTESGIHIDDTCGTSNNNVVTSNNINEGCAGILEGATSTGNTISSNTFYNVVTTILSGDTCTLPSYAPAARSAAPRSHKALRPSPYNPMRRYVKSGYRRCRPNEAGTVGRMVGSSGDPASSSKVNVGARFITTP
jgi:hypothetical protein